MQGSEKCCICGRQVQSYHNPEPVREGTLDCCSDCNRLVVGARRKYAMLSENERAAFVSRLRVMTHRELKDAFGGEDA